LFSKVLRVAAAHQLLSRDSAIAIDDDGGSALFVRNYCVGSAVDHTIDGDLDVQTHLHPSSGARATIAVILCYRRIQGWNRLGVPWFHRPMDTDPKPPLKFDDLIEIAARGLEQARRANLSGDRALADLVLRDLHGAGVRFVRRESQ
jgi:hypothetical protein